MRPLIVLISLFAVSCMPVSEWRDAPADSQTYSLLGKPLSSPPADADTRHKLALAEEEFRQRPDDVDALIWYGRRTAYTGDFRAAVRIFSDGIERFPDDPRLYRHRGHRYITLRDFDRAIADLEHAAQLIEGTPNEVEPDGLPNARNIPVSTLHGNIWYHLGLAYYLKHDWPNARRAYENARATGAYPDNLVSTTHWLYMIHRRMGNEAAATAALEPIVEGLDVIENTSYYRLCLVYKGLLDAASLRGSSDNPAGAATAYGLANWDYYNGDTDAAVRQWTALTTRASWPAFGVIAAEADLAQLD